MQILDSPARSELFLVRDFLDAQERASVSAEARAAAAHPAPVYIEGAEGLVHEDVRKTSSLEVSAALVSEVERRLRELRGRIEEHFGLSLKGCEPPQFLRYGEGDFFVRHQDGDTDQMEFDHLRVRKVSVVVFLNGASEEPRAETYDGGALVIYRAGVDAQAGPLVFPIPGEAGLLVAFRSDTLHEVTPVTRGERFTVVSWFN
ncbi:MAG TPA: 2OG-Fe(II) oxygenase [Pyrinomonadaceae bacterium]|jgi:SM-20-related protein|nr:2OG-Fe(II) oxygenase [Pyrinomonadaceae bacterium]